MPLLAICGVSGQLFMVADRLKDVHSHGAASAVTRGMAVLGLSAALLACTADGETESAPADVVTTSHREPAPQAEVEEHQIRGTNGDDVLVGTSGRDVIDGRRGADVIRARGGDDELSDYTGVGTGKRLDTTPDAFHGGAGNDVIYSSGHDRVSAGSGDDTVYANYAKAGDSISCGLGSDVVVLNDDDPGLNLTGCEKVRIAYAG